MPGIEVEGYRKEETWKNRVSYWMAAVGSAVGLGNIWRFPWRVYTNGGGAFLIAYFIVLFFIGMPMLTQEMALGQKFQGGDVEAYGRMNRRFRGVGLDSVVAVFVTMAYYSTVIAYSFIYFARSFESPLPWAYDGTYGNYSECLSVIGGSNCSHSDGSFGYCPSTVADCENSAVNFLVDFTKQAPDIHSGNGEIAWGCVGASLFVWVCVYCSVFKGVKSVSYIIFVTVPVPILFLLILMIKALTLEGAGTGVSDYLSTDLSVLAGSKIWLDAITQCFFSLSICMGIMTAYSSFTRSGSVALDEKVVAFADVSIAFISGFCIYGILGYLNRSAIEDGDDPDYGGYGGFGLVFIAIPVALLKFEYAGFFSALFFFMLFTLGIDSAFSGIEGFATAICDTDMAKKKKWTKTGVSFVLCVIGFLMSIGYCTDVGGYHTGIIDNFVFTKGFTFIGMMESFVLGWVFLYDHQCQVVGAPAVNLWNYGYWSLLVFCTMVCFFLAFPRYDDGDALVDFNGGPLGHNSFWIGFAICIVGWPSLAFVAVNRAKAFNQNLSTREAIWGVTGWWGAEDIREHVNSGGGTSEWKSSPDEERRICLSCDCSKLSIGWGWLLKYFIPGLLFVLLCDQLRKEHYDPYMGFEFGSAYQMEGMLPFVFMLLAVFGVMAFPSLMEQSYDQKYVGKSSLANEMVDTQWSVSVYEL